MFQPSGDVVSVAKLVSEQVTKARGEQSREQSRKPSSEHNVDALPAMQYTCHMKCTYGLEDS